MYARYTRRQHSNKLCRPYNILFGSLPYLLHLQHPRSRPISTRQERVRRRLRGGLQRARDGCNTQYCCHVQCVLDLVREATQHHHLANTRAGTQKDFVLLEVGCHHPVSVHGAIYMLINKKWATIPLHIIF